MVCGIGVSMSAVAQCHTVNHTKIKHTVSTEVIGVSGAVVYRLEAFQFELETECVSFLKGNTVCRLAH